jgi:hypothetical protein
MKKILSLLIILFFSSTMALGQYGGNIQYTIEIGDYMAQKHPFNVSIWPTNANSSYIYCDNPYQIIRQYYSPYTTHCSLSHYDDIKDLFTTTFNSYVEDTVTHISTRCNIRYTLDPNTLHIAQQHTFIINENHLGTWIGCEQIN